MTGEPVVTPAAVISRRLSIAWPSSRVVEQREPHEPTDTLVLRFESFYLDLRIGLPDPTEDVPGQIVWAQAGKIVKAPKSDDPSALPDIDFIPIADSLPAPPAHVPKLPDCGSFDVLPNGDVSEKGVMYNPDSRADGESWGRNEEYVEVWRRLSPLDLFDEEMTAISHRGYLPCSMTETEAQSLLLEAIPIESTFGSGKIITHAFIGRAGVRALGISVSTYLEDVPDARPVPIFVSGFKDYLVWRKEGLVRANGGQSNGSTTSASQERPDAQEWLRIYSSRSATPACSELGIPAQVIAKLDVGLPHLPTLADRGWPTWKIGEQVSWPTPTEQISRPLPITTRRQDSATATGPTCQEIRYVPYESEEAHLPAIMDLCDQELSEPYSIYTFRYFLQGWPHLAFLTYPSLPPSSSDASAFPPPTPIACIICKQESHRGKRSRGYIAMLTVDRRWRRKGIARRLVRIAVEGMIASGADEIVLETEFDNQPSISLYTSLGFFKEKRLARFYMNGKDAFRLVLPIPQNTPFSVFPPETEAEASEAREALSVGNSIDHDGLGGGPNDGNMQVDGAIAGSPPPMPDGMDMAGMVDGYGIGGKGVNGSGSSDEASGSMQTMGEASTWIVRER